MMSLSAPSCNGDFGKTGVDRSVQPVMFRQKDG